ncbi:hypothetical protein Scep_015527 [Stephania cephalantha]|uniref:Fatty acyl-CoA reductase n=1 Tax=Stephania cephalantha TaxID=152367 RepID=A0AAP0J349_9MAGN
MDQLDIILEFLKKRSILITGSTGFLGKLFVEKVLRVQPEVKRLYLLIRAADSQTAMQRLRDEVIGNELFKNLREMHGTGFEAFLFERMIPVAGNIARENLGIADSKMMEEMWREVTVVVNLAAITNFSASVRVRGEVWTCGREAFSGWGNTKRKPDLDIKQEIDLANETLEQLRSRKATNEDEKVAMKELGLTRARITIDHMFIGYGKGKVRCFLGNSKCTLDLIPGDMVVNTIIMAMVANANQLSQAIYHVGSSIRNPVNILKLKQYGHSYFSNHPWIGRDGKVVRVREPIIFTKTDSFYRYMNIRYVLPFKSTMQSDAVEVSVSSELQWESSQHFKKLSLRVKGDPNEGRALRIKQEKLRWAFTGAVVQPEDHNAQIIAGGVAAS